jgi:transposase
LERAKSVHGDFYDYDEAVYTGGKSVVSIRCPKHGSFQQVAASHLNGWGCPTCDLEDEAAVKNKRLEGFKDRAIAIHGSVYDYSKVEYVNLQTKVTIGCPIHGPFVKTPSQHLYGGGCPTCGMARRGRRARPEDRPLSPPPTKRRYSPVQATQGQPRSDRSAPLSGMTGKPRRVVLNDEQWAVLEPLIDECRPRGRTEPVALRETIEAIVWRHQTGESWSRVPPDLVPWWRAAQTFIRWSHMGVWERLLDLAQERGVALGMVSHDSAPIQARHGSTGVSRNADLEHSALCVKRLVALAAATPKPA